MCGIAGIASVRADGVDPAAVRAMIDTLTHRGPDGEGISVLSHAVLGHRRLAIIDLSDAGLQPMLDSVGESALVCNGEIYNYPDLRAQLVARGHRLCSKTDVETILHLHAERGADCVHDLVGMFAFGLWHAPTKRLLLARDRIGEKPLYYALGDGRIAFASEAKALLALKWVDRTPDEEAIAGLPIYQSAPGDKTFFKGISQLPPAHRLIWQDGRTTVERYWRVTSFGGFVGGAKARQAEYGHLVRRAVEGCLLADVEVAVTLSGGVDSTTIAAEAARLSPGISTYCVGYDAPGRPDPEFERARMVADKLGTHHESLQFEPAKLHELPRIVERYDQPFNSYPMIYADPLMQKIRERAKVVIAGNGADEMFGGYSGYNTAINQERRRRLGRFVPQRLAAHIPGAWGRKLEAFAARARIDAASLRSVAAEAEAQAAARRLFRPAFAALTRDMPLGRHLELWTQDTRGADYVDALMYSDLMAYHTHGHCTIPDVASMTYGLEARAPFLDHRLVEFAYTLPLAEKIPDPANPSLNKAIMKRWLAQEFDETIAYGPKTGFGFGINVKAFVAGPWRRTILRLVGEGAYLDMGWIDPDEARIVADRGTFADTWMLLVLSIWTEIYVVGRSPDALATQILADQADA
jgi:asparagine synthase (glutamine-hydrolysing)